MNATRPTPHQQLPQDLTDRLAEYAFPDLLAPRIAAEQQWSAAHTAAVLTEYRRFLLLAATTTRSVTPSRAVDAAWHEHLTFTRDYWERLCGDVLRRSVHHEPAGPGSAVGDDTRAAYRLTLQLYADTFGEAPPAHLWPDPDAPRAGDGPRVGAAGARRAGRTRLPVVVAILAASVAYVTAGQALTGLLLAGVTGLLTYSLLGAALGAGARGASGSGGSSAGGDGSSFFGLDFGGGDGGSDSGGSDTGGGDGGSSCGSSCGSGCGS